MKRLKTKLSIKSEDNDLHSNRNAVKSNPKDLHERAKKNLLLAKEFEKTKTDFIWIVKEKTRKLVNPLKISAYLNDGWKLAKSQTKN